MHRVLQTRFGRGGNCHQAALASLLGLALDDVPDFCNRHGDDWMDRENEWLARYGLFCMYQRADEVRDGSLKYASYYVPCIVAVQSLATLGLLHSVIMHRGQVVHDPHPSQCHRWREVDIVGVDLMLRYDVHELGMPQIPSSDECCTGEGR